MPAVYPWFESVRRKAAGKASSSVSAKPRRALARHRLCFLESNAF